MISLDVEDYCSDCDEFEPTLEVETSEYADFIHCRTVIQRNTLVRCEHHERCRCINDYIKEKIEKDGI